MLKMLRNLLPLPQAFRLPVNIDRDLLDNIYKDFVAAAAALPDRTFSGGTINNTDFMPEIITKYLGKNRHHISWIVAVKEILKTSRFEPHNEQFAASMLAAAADALLKAGHTEDALSFAELAFSRSIYDLWVQSILLTCRAEADGDRKRIAETEDWLKTRFCAAPFESLETTTASEMTVCCPLWLPVPVGTFQDESIESVLNSAPMHRLRDSVLDGSFRHCSRMHCVKITQRELPARDIVDIEAYKRSTFPKEVTFSHDPTCNLSCPSCRGHIIVIPKSEQDRFDSVSRFLLPLMINADWVKICGSGDPFASMHFRNLLKKYCSDPRAHQNIILHTNGVLCDQRAWSELGLGPFVKSVLVSLDAAKEDTYKYTRRDGQWDRALKNVRFLSDLKSKGTIETLELLFVVQGRNYEEMVDFIHLAKEYGADKVLLQAISNWGTYSEAEYAEHNIFSAQHPGHTKLLDILDDEIFDDPIVDLFSVGKFRRR